jgi:ribose transport system permease protein
VFATLILIAIFSLLLPNTFLTWINARLIMSDQATTALLALAARLKPSIGLDAAFYPPMILFDIDVFDLES